MEECSLWRVSTEVPAAGQRDAFCSLQHSTVAVRCGVVRRSSHHLFICSPLRLFVAQHLSSRNRIRRRNLYNELRCGRSSSVCVVHPSDLAASYLFKRGFCEADAAAVVVVAATTTSSPIISC